MAPDHRDMRAYTRMRRNDVAKSGFSDSHKNKKPEIFRSRASRVSMPQQAATRKLT